MTPKLFRQINQVLARLIYAPDTSAEMRAAAKDARQSLHRLFGTGNKPTRLHNVQTARTPPSTS